MFLQQPVPLFVPKNPRYMEPLPSLLAGSQNGWIYRHQSVQLLSRRATPTLRNSCRGFQLTSEQNGGLGMLFLVPSDRQSWYRSQFFRLDRLVTNHVVNARISVSGAMKACPFVSLLFSCYGMYQSRLCPTKVCPLSVH